MNCEFCQSPAHIWFQCPKKPEGWKPVRLAKESTAARKDVREAEGSTTYRDLGKKLSTDNRKCSSDVGGCKRGRSVASVAEPERLAGTQDLLVDTNHGDNRHALRLGNPDQASGDNVTAHTRPPGAVTGKFDKVAYMRFYMRRRRAKAKADLEVQEGSK